MVKNASSTWWIPLARRVVIWGLVMAALWFLAALLLLTLPLLALYFPDAILGPDDEPSGGFPISGQGILIGMLQFLVVLLLGGFSLCGLIAGIVAALCAPASEISDPLRSRFFRSVAINALLCWILLTFAALVAIGVAEVFFGILTFVYDWWMVSLGFWFGLFVLSLWRAINRALGSSKNPLL